MRTARLCFEFGPEGYIGTYIRIVTLGKPTGRVDFPNNNPLEDFRIALSWLTLANLPFEYDESIDIYLEGDLVYCWLEDEEYGCVLALTEQTFYN